jgi:hypothetical protein
MPGAVWRHQKTHQIGVYLNQKFRQSSGSAINVLPALPGPPLHVRSNLTRFRRALWGYCSSLSLSADPEPEKMAGERIAPLNDDGGLCWPVTAWRLGLTRLGIGIRLHRATYSVRYGASV